MTRLDYIPNRVMVIDDDPFMLDVLDTLLEDIGCSEVLLDENAEDALARFAGLERQPELLICDLCMPGMDGIEFLRKIAEQGYQGDMILLSGMDAAVLKAAELLAKSYAVPLLGTLSKPISSDALAGLISRHQDGSATSSAPARSTRERPSIAELREAIINDEITIYFQPKASLATQQIHSAECLARWIHPLRGMIEPLHFIGLAEESGLIHDLTLVILRKAARQLSAWRQDGHDIHLSVNVSMDDLNQLDIPEVFSGMMNIAGISPEDITLEITETRLAQDFVLSLDVLTRLRIKGFGLSIDDFGTGYSSLESLKQLPFTELKVDQSFVRNAGNDANTRSILESSLKLGRDFHLNLVAEGVETQSEWNLVAALGCIEAQGYFISRPLPAAEFLAFKHAWEAAHPAPPDFSSRPASDAALNEEKPLIVIADDDTTVHELVREALGQDFRLVHVDDGVACLKALDEYRPQLLVLDIEMPRLDGLSTCQKLKESESFHDLPVMFLSGKDNLDDRLRCYEAGAEDFLFKPFKFDLFVAKVRRLIQLARERRDMKQNTSMATNAAMTAMTSMSEMGTLLEGLKSLNSCQTWLQLAEASLVAMQMFGLEGTVQLRHGKETLTYSNKGLASPLDISVIEHMRQMDRIIHFKARMCINYDHATLLVNNMPNEDADRSGRLRDHIAMLAEAIDIRLVSICASLEAKARGEVIERLARHLTETLEHAGASQSQQRTAASRIAAEIIDVVEATLLKVALSSSQEEVLAHTIRNGLEDIIRLLDAQDEVQNELAGLVADVNAKLG